MNYTVKEYLNAILRTPDSFNNFVIRTQSENRKMKFIERDYKKDAERKSKFIERDYKKDTERKMKFIERDYKINEKRKIKY